MHEDGPGEDGDHHAQDPGHPVQERVPHEVLQRPGLQAAAGGPPGVLWWARLKVVKTSGNLKDGAQASLVCQTQLVHDLQVSVLPAF